IMWRCYSRPSPRFGRRGSGYRRRRVQTRPACAWTRRSPRPARAPVARCCRPNRVRQIFRAQREATMNRKPWPRKSVLGPTLLVFAAFGAAEAQGIKPKEAAVRHPNLLLNQEEIQQIKRKVQEHPWAARLLDRVKAKAGQDGA